MKTTFAIFWMVSLFLFATPIVFAQSTAQPTLRLAKWGVETSPVYPLFAQNYLVQGTRTLWQSGSVRGDLILGAEVINHTKADDITRSEKGVYWVVGYRQYLWRGLHVQVSDFITSQLKVQSAIDGNTYAGAANVLGGFVGYRFAIPIQQAAFYLMPQVGIEKSVSVSQPWPRQSTGIEFIPNLLVGISF